MPKTSYLRFFNYSVEKISFEKVPVTGNQREFQLSPHYNQELIEIGNNKYDVRLSIEITPTETAPIPFSLQVTIVGHFSYESDAQDNNKDQILKTNTVSILFPFLRQIVATLTSTANIPTLMLPIMNFASNPIKEEL